jgi:hypothetical protein
VVGGLYSLFLHMHLTLFDESVYDNSPVQTVVRDKDETFAILRAHRGMLQVEAAHVRSLLTDESHISTIDLRKATVNTTRRSLQQVQASEPFVQVCELISAGVPARGIISERGAPQPTPPHRLSALFTQELLPGSKLKASDPCIYVRKWSTPRRGPPPRPDHQSVP